MKIIRINIADNNTYKIIYNNKSKFISSDILYLLFALCFGAVHLVALVVFR
jgi:hypothetical protein